MPGEASSVLSWRPENQPSSGASQGPDGFARITNSVPVKVPLPVHLQGLWLEAASTTKTEVRRLVTCTDSLRTDFGRLLRFSRVAVVVALVTVSGPWSMNGSPLAVFAVGAGHVAHNQIEMQCGRGHKLAIAPFAIGAVIAAVALNSSRAVIPAMIRCQKSGHLTRQRSWPEVIKSRSAAKIRPKEDSPKAQAREARGKLLMRPYASKSGRSAVSAYPGAVAAQRACSGPNGKRRPNSRPARPPQRRSA